MNSQEYNEHLKLVEAKQMRKRVDEDARLLSNRISLLKQEELKALKKIEETRKKAQEIIEGRNRNLKEEQRRESIRRQKEEEDNMKNEQNRIQRDQLRSIKQQANKYRFDQAMQEIKSIKVHKQNNLKTLEFKRFEELNQKIKSKNKIKEQQREAEEKRKRMAQEKMEKTKLELLNKAKQEDSIRMMKQDYVSRLEQQELELIQRLQNTQILQKNAYEDLESALSGQIL